MSAQRPVVRQTLILLIAMLAVTLVVVVVKRSRALASPTGLSTLQGDDGALVRAKRAMAVTAIEKSDYQLAIKTLTEIIKEGNGIGDELELLQIAKDLQLRFATAGAPAPTPAAAAPPRAPAPARTEAEAEATDTASLHGEERPKRAPATRTRAPAQPPPTPREPPPPAPGRLIVASTPPGLTIKVDGEEVGHTPFQQAIAPGVHSVVLLKDGNRLGQQQAEVVSGRVVSVDLDVSERLRELERPVPPPPRPVELTPPPPPPTTEAASREPASVPASAAAATGSLKVTVSNLTGGIVYVDGQRRGPAPLVIDKLPAGKRVLVELSVRNFIERSTRVEIEGGKTAEVSFR